MDLGYYHSVEIIFYEVSYIDCPTSFDLHIFREATEEEKNELRKNKLFYCDEGIISCIEIGYGNFTEKHFIVAQSINYNFDTVFHYKRENLKAGERLADWLE